MARTDTEARLSSSTKLLAKRERGSRRDRRLTLPDDLRVQFEAEYGARLAAAYAKKSYGTVLPFRRIFAVAQKEG